MCFVARSSARPASRVFKYVAPPAGRPPLRPPRLADLAARLPARPRQSDEEHTRTKLAAERFLADPAQGPRLQQLLVAYDRERDSYIEEFWYESYLGQTESVVLSLNPFVPSALLLGGLLGRMELGEIGS